MHGTGPLPTCAAVLLGGCASTIQVDADRIAFLEVSLAQAFSGTEAAPAPFSTEAVHVEVRVQALDREARPLALDAVLSLDTRPGTLDSPTTVRLEEGAWQGRVTLRHGFGPTRIWFRDDQPQVGRDPTWVAAVSDALWFALPTLAQVQATGDHESNSLEGEFAELRTADREVVVTALGANGFWVTDLMDPPGDFNALFVYTFDRPEAVAAEEGEYAHAAGRDILLGERLSLLSGTDQEYLATTQISHPFYTFTRDAPAALPAALVLDSATACDDDAMERLESSLVRAEDVVIPSSFSSDDPDFQDYGQWPIDLDGCRLYAESSGTVPGWHPADHAGERLSYLQGLLQEVWGKWILLPRDPTDIAGASSAPGARTSPSGPPARPVPRPRP
ncbi:MAG: hypothetical protein JXB39_01190 [Deltaproteobacteria bacterium]|nr:hypothetical protein [Deltaproteobacteria bacterium]